MKAVISVANVAGGVGKTTTAIHVAAELALRGYDTILIDADPQAEATARLIEPDGVRFSVADVLLAPDPSGHFLSVERNVSLADVLVPTRLMSLHLAPSTIRLAAAEGDFPFSFHGLNSQLRSLDVPCDFAIIDIPSSLGPIFMDCLLASTHLLAPVSPRAQGLHGLSLLIENLGNVRRGQTEVKWLGVVCNMFECRSHSSGEFYEELKRDWGDKVFETIIHRDDLIEGCAERHMPVQAFAPQSKAASLYSELADEVMARLTVAPHIGHTDRQMVQSGANLHSYLGDQEALTTGASSTLRPRSPSISPRVPTATHAVRILLAEDDKLVRGAVRETLESEGWEVVGCEDGARALAEVKGGGHYDLIIADYCMPGVDGLGIVRAARTLEHRRGTPIIMLTASPVEREARAAGANLFLRKPESIGRLIDAVKVLLGGN